jgi:predicted nucleotidyltransferase
MPATPAPEMDRQELLQEIVRRIVAAVQPEKIILFGSAVRGGMGPDSDLDFLVVKACASRRETARAIRRPLFGITVPIDIVVATPEDLERFGDTIGLIYRPALQEGKVVYAA